MHKQESSSDYDSELSDSCIGDSDLEEIEKNLDELNKNMITLKISCKDLPD